MALNPAYEAIGKGFVQQYYALFDDPVQRPNLVNMYNTESSFMTFEGMQLQGSIKIMEKLNGLSFQKINRIITAVDSQPMFDGGVLINVLGRLQIQGKYVLTAISHTDSIVKAKNGSTVYICFYYYCNVLLNTSDFLMKNEEAGSVQRNVADVIKKYID